VRRPSRRLDVSGEDEIFMGEALAEAKKAARAGEVPVGAVLVEGGEIVARGHNLRETWSDPTAHAEVVVLREAARLRGTWRLEGTTIYVTVEPCAMCAGALVLARVGRLVYGVADPKAGAAGTLLNVVQDGRLNHQLEVTSGVLAAESAEVIREFFRTKRGE
jgi:tRNA(adenine34) deaminase